MTHKIGFIGRQLNNAKFLKESYELANKEPFGHLLIDLDPNTSDVLRYCSNIVPPGPSIFYLPSTKAVITSLSDEKERSLYAGAAARDIGHKLKAKIERAPNHFIKFRCEYLLNIVNVYVPIRKSFVEVYEKSFRDIFCRQKS